MALLSLWCGARKEAGVTNLHFAKRIFRFPSFALHFRHWYILLDHFNLLFDSVNDTTFNAYAFRNIAIGHNSPTIYSGGRCVTTKETVTVWSHLLFKSKNASIITGVCVVTPM